MSLFHSNTEIEQLSDEVLCTLVANGNANAEDLLVNRYSRLVRVCSRPLFLVGGDHEDLIQEGMLGLLTAIRSFQREREASFRTYAEVCIRNRLRNAIRAARRGKHSPLNNYISFELPLFDGTSKSFLHSEKNPEDVIINREEFKELITTLKSELSSFEAEILSLYLGGLTCAEIAQEVQRSTKSVDNAVQRIRKKFERQLPSGAYSES